MISISVGKSYFSKSNSNFVFYGVDSMATIMSFLGYTEYPDQTGVNGCYFVWKGKAREDEIIKALRILIKIETKKGCSSINIRKKESNATDPNTSKYIFCTSFRKIY